jgi:LPXTG-motif cell wall-anchored protein
VNTNKLTSLDLNGSIAIKRLDCSYNSLSSLDVHDQTGLNYLYCNNNKLTALNVTDLDSLLTLICNDNKLSGTFDLTSLPGLRYFLYQNNSIASLKFGDEWLNLLIGYNNPTTSITTKMFTEDSSEQTFSANSGGYLSFNMNSSTYSIYLYSQSKENNVFVNYTTDGSQISVSPIHYINPGDPDPNDIAANFSAGLASSDEDGIIYEGGRITLSPYYSDGTWGYNENYFSATFTDPNSPVFKGLKKGTTTITYTMPADTYTYEEPFEFIKSIDEPIFTTEDEENPQYAVPDLPDQNLTISMTVTINETVLPQTGQDFTVSVILAGTGLAGITALFLVSRKKKKSA